MRGEGGWRGLWCDGVGVGVRCGWGGDCAWGACGPAFQLLFCPPFASATAWQLPSPLVPTSTPPKIVPSPAGVLVLEELEHAKARGAPILAEFVGGAFTCDAHHMTEPEPAGKGVIMCIERALVKAGVSPEQVCRGAAPGCVTLCLEGVPRR